MEDSGWLRFRALFDYIPTDGKEIAFSANNILIVAKPVEDQKGWLLAHNEQTGQEGEVPGTYLEYVDDIDEFLPPEPEAPPPIPPRPSAKSGHRTIKIHCTRHVFCHCCEDFIWGNNNEYYKCQACEITCHLNCSVVLPTFQCHKKEATTEEDPYELLVASIEEWTIEDVMSWLAVTNYYTHADVFRDFGINGSKLQMLNEQSLVQMGIQEKTHQLSLLYAIKELFTGDSPQKESQSFIGFHRAPTGTNGEHEFRVQNFENLHWCDKCGKCLWGLYQQGVQCYVCGLCCHHMCKRDGIPVCPGRRVKASSDDDDGGVNAFGQALVSQFSPSHRMPAPTVVMKCVDAIQKRGFRVEEIYRITPIGHEKSSLRAALNQNPSQVLMTDQEWCNPLCIAAVLKMFFQELPSCLFTEDRYDEFIHIGKRVGSGSIDDLITLIDGLPHHNKSVILYLMEHLFKVSQHQQFNKMASLDLARVFAHILLRPKKQEKIKMSVNHDCQIQVVDILISQGPWSICQPTEDDVLSITPPPVPQRSRKPKLKAESPPPPPEPELVNEALKDQVWYWGQTSKETVQERMKEAEDGSFVVRDSKRNLGEYTLTLRKGGSSKLIRIVYQNGKYGFSEPLTFDSVVDLINYYHDRSLAQYNVKLDVKLTCPLHKYEQESESEDLIVEHLEKLYHELESKSIKYEELHNTYENLAETTNELQLVKDAQKTVVTVIKEQMEIHESFQKIAPPQSRAVLRQNFEMLKHRLIEAQCELLEAERELSNTAEMSRETDQEMNTLRAQIIELQAQKETYMDILVNEKGYSQDEVKEIVNEGIRQGCIYQVPDIDLSERNWRFGMIDRGEAAEMLEDCPDGTFLIRDSINHPGSYSVTLSFDFTPRHIHIVKGARGYGFNKEYAVYPTLKDLVEHYHNNTLQKHNRHLATKLVYPIRFFKKNLKPSPP